MNPQACYDEYLDALLHGQRGQCERIVRALLADALPVRALYGGLFRPALYQVGALWQANCIAVATEHRATAITQDLMNDLVAPLLFARQPVGRSLLVACQANDFHQVGGRMVADIAELNGWDTCFLGADTALPTLLLEIDARRPDALALSVAFYQGLPGLRLTLAALQERHPALPVWIGGQALAKGGQELAAGYAQVQLFSALEEFESELQRCAAPLAE